MPRPAPETVHDGRDDDEILTALGLTHPDRMEAGDDFAAFLRAAVPEHLRRIALRRLWRLKPELAVLDGLVEYGEDYTDSATVVENLQTVYRVGKGMLADLKEADEKIAAIAGEDPTGDDGTMPEADATYREAESSVRPPAQEDAPEELAAAPAAAAEAAPDEPDAHETPGPTRRRMAFRFDRT